MAVNPEQRALPHPARHHVGQAGAGHLRRMTPQTLANLRIHEVPNTLFLLSTQDLVGTVWRQVQDKPGLP